MKRYAAGVGFLMTVFLAMPMTGHAQLLDSLKNLGGNAGGAQGGSGLPGGALPSVNQASPGNLAGVLQYCVKNNYLNGGSASSVAQSLLGRQQGGTRDSGFSSGENGILQSGNGQGFALGGGGIKQQVTHKVCDMVLQHGKSLL